MKKTAAMLVTLLLCLSCVLAEEAQALYVVNFTDTALIVSSSGEIVLQGGEFSSIYALEGFSVYAAVTEDGKITVIDEKGNALTEKNYDDIYAEGGSIFVTTDGKTGVLDAEYGEKIACRYTQLVSNGEGGYLGIVTDLYDDKADGVYYIDQSGTEKATGIRVKNGLSTFSEGLSCVTSAENGDYGYINAQGEWAISAQYTYAMDFAQGYAVAMLDSGVGMIDTNGKWLLTPKYAALLISGGDAPLIMAQEDNESCIVIDNVTFDTLRTFRGEEVYFDVFYDINRGLVYMPDKTEYIDEKGNTILEGDIYLECTACEGMDGLVIRNTQEGYALCDEKGNQLSEACQSVEYLCTWQGKRYFVEWTYETETETEEDWVGTFAVEGSEKCGIIDENGNSIMSGMSLGSFYGATWCGGGFISLETDDENLLYRLTESEIEEILKLSK